MNKNEFVDIIKVSDLVGKKLRVIEVRLDNPSPFGDADLYIFIDKDVKSGFFSNSLRDYGIKKGDEIILCYSVGKHSKRKVALTEHNGKILAHA